MSEVGVEHALTEENGEVNGDVENPLTPTKDTEDVPSREIVLDEKDDPIAEENGDKEEKKDEEQEDDDTSGLEEGEFEVERILDVKLKDGMVKFEVRWKGYGSEEDSWEPEENLESARLILDDYIATNKEKVDKVKRKLDDRKKRGKKNRNRQSSHATSKERRGNRKGRRTSGSAVELSESDEDDKGKEEKEETQKGTQQKKKCKDHDEEVSSNAAESSGDEDFVTSSRHSKRAKKVDEHKVNAPATRGTRRKEEPLLKELCPRNAKNAWLYDDADDGDSDDDSDRNDSSKKQKKGLEEEKNEADAPNKADKRGKRHSTLDEGIRTASKRSRKESSSEPTSKKDEKKKKSTDGKKRKKERSPVVIGDEEQEDGAVTTAEDDAAEDNKSVDDNITRNKTIGRAATNTESVEVVGIVKMKDSGVQVMCRKKNGKAHLLTVEEVVAVNAMALVEYLLARTIFTSGTQ